MKFNTLYTFNSPDVITDTGVRKIQSIITSVREGEWLGGRKYMPALPLNFEYVWVNKNGKFTKRMAKYYKTQHGIKLPEDFLSEIGNIARQYSLSGVTYNFQIVDSIDWEDGDFGDGGSCYWGDHASAKDMIIENNGLAICFFDEGGDGMGRAWLFNAGEFWIIWNGYGFAGNPTRTIASVFAQWQGLGYTKIRLTNDGTDTGMLYINSGIGYAIGNDVQISYYDFGWESYNSCYRCGDVLTQDDTYVGTDDMQYCQNCFYEYFDYCQNCNDVHDMEDMIYIDESDEYLCQHCTDRHYTCCPKCYQYHSGSTCPNCTEDKK